MASMGNRAPSEKARAEEPAASSGLALVFSWMPISSRACADSASCALSCTATSCASSGSSPRCI